MIVIQNGDADADDALLELFARIGEAGLDRCREFFSEPRVRGDRIGGDLCKSRARQDSVALALLKGG